MSGDRSSLAGEITSPALCSKCGSVTRIIPIVGEVLLLPSSIVRQSGSCWHSLMRSVTSKSVSGTQSLSIKAMWHEGNIQRSNGPVQ